MSYSPQHDPYQDRLRTDLNYDDAVLLEPAKFCECECWSYCLGCSFSIVLLLAFSAIFLLFAPPLGFLLAALSPGIVILLLAKRYYKGQVTNGQMTVSFLETIMWMIPLLAWDLIWILAIAPQLKEGGLCALCVLAYAIQAYFFAGFCEEVVKFIVISRITNCSITNDWRTMLVYGICAGCGFATAENIAYVFSGGFATAVVRAFVSVPLHCCTGAIIGMEIALRRPMPSNCQTLSTGEIINKTSHSSSTLNLWLVVVIWPVVLFPWLVHGSFDFFLMLGEGSHSSLGALGFAAAVVVFLFGLAYCRNLSFRVREKEASYGRQKIDIHERILAGQPAVLGLPSIRQWGTSTECVCSCCFLALCCCSSSAHPPDQHHQAVGLNMVGQNMQPVQPYGPPPGPPSHQEQQVDVYVYA